jgi:hypothetical protein
VHPIVSPDAPRLPYVTGRRDQIKTDPLRIPLQAADGMELRS